MGLRLARKREELRGVLDWNSLGERVDIDGQQIPVFGSVREAMQATDANVTVNFVPAKFTMTSTRWYP